MISLYLKTVEENFKFYSDSRWTQASGALCTAVATEAFLRVIFNAQEEDNKSDRIAVNLGHAFFYGISALNLIPGTARITALGFTLLSACKTSKDPGNYFIARAIRFPVEKILQVISDLAKRVLDGLIIIFSHPLIDKPIKRVLDGLIIIFSHLPIDKPIWRAVSLLLVLTGGYKYALLIKDRIIK